MIYKLQIVIKQRRIPGKTRKSAAYFMCNYITKISTKKKMTAKLQFAAGPLFFTGRSQFFGKIKGSNGRTTPSTYRRMLRSGTIMKNRVLAAQQEDAAKREWTHCVVKGNRQEQKGFPPWDGEGDSCIWRYQNDYKRLQRLLLPHKEFPAFEGNTCSFWPALGYNGADQR